MKKLTFKRLFHKRSFSAQGMVEFALVLPILLALIFGIIEFGRIFQAWLSVQNSARFAVRYAVTGQYNTDYCDDAAAALAGNIVFTKYLTNNISPAVNPTTADTYGGDLQDCRVPLDFANSLKTYLPFSTMTADAATLAIGETIQNMTNALQDYARLQSIHDITRNDAFAIAMDLTKTQETDLGYFKVVVLSTRVHDYCVDTLHIDWFSCVTYSKPGEDKYWSAGPSGYEDPGGPGNSVLIGVDFNHPLITPFLMQAWPYLHLTTYREGIVENFRSSKTVNIAPPLSMPSPTASMTPSITNTPTSTNTPTNTPSPTPTDTLTPTNTLTPTDTLTPSLTALPPTATPITPTPLPKCSLMSIGTITMGTNNLTIQLKNTNPMDIDFTDADLTWTKWYTGQTLDYWTIKNTTPYEDDTDDTTSPSSTSFNYTIPAGTTKNLIIQFKGFAGSMYGTYSITTTFDIPGCSKTKSTTKNTPLPPTPIPPTPLPDCAKMSIGTFTIATNKLTIQLKNGNPMPIDFTGADLTWTKWFTGQTLDYWTISPTVDNTDDGTSPSSTSFVYTIPANTNKNLIIQFKGFTGSMYGSYTLDASFDIPGCSKSKSVTQNTPVPPTPIPPTPIPPTATSIPPTPIPPTATPVTPTIVPTATIFHTKTPTLTNTPSGCGVDC